MHRRRESDPRQKTFNIQHSTLNQLTTAKKAESAKISATDEHRWAQIFNRRDAEGTKTVEGRETRVEGGNQAQKARGILTAKDTKDTKRQKAWDERQNFGVGQKETKGTKKFFPNQSGSLLPWLSSVKPCSLPARIHVYLCESVVEVQAHFGGQKIPGAKK